ncbi:MAG: DUF3566 domain-containing protein [Actinobacteria bacterium]|nr:DUF3566 domain-containing protein [Actinomycetota bacterium]
MSTSPKSAPRIRRVTRVIRDIDPWSVFKVGLVFHFVAYLIMLVALVLLWSVASATGTIDNIQQFMKSFGWESFEFNGGQLFVNVMILGLLGVVLATALWVLAATIFNLITDLVGGIRVTVLEEEVVVGSVESQGKR